jgi:hypothetical protein
MGCVVVQLGQGGNQMASAFFNALASLSQPATASQDFFRDSSTGEHMARAVLIDMEPKVGGTNWFLEHGFGCFCSC